MNDFNNINASRQTLDMSVDAGLRAFMIGVYNKMGLGLAWSAVLAYGTSSVPAIRDQLFTAGGGYTMLGMILSFAPLAVILFGMFALRNANPRSANIYYWTVVSLIGAGLGVLALRYTGESLASTFLITAIAFGGLSLFGYTTKKNLTGMGTFLIMAVWGLLIAMIANMFFQNGIVSLIISGLGVLIFSGLIAFETQNLKHTYYAIGGHEASLSVATSFGALNLYISFINLFQFLLSFLGNRD